MDACRHILAGVYPTLGQWQELAERIYSRGVVPLFDFAYQGFGNGLREDAAGMLAFLREDAEFFIASSYSKNFGLYNERVGALTAVSRQPAEAEAVLSQLKRIVRGNYSNPPSHGGSIVATIGRDAELRAAWEVEVEEMRDRINGMRKLFVDTLASLNAPRDFSFIQRHRGMFSLTGLTPAEVDELRSKHAVYVVGDGRINVAGMTERNMPALCEAIAAVL